MEDFIKGRKLLDDSLKKKLLSIDRKTFTINDMSNLFGETYDTETKSMKKAEIPRNTYFELKAGEYTNQKNIQTTPGIFMYNKLFVEGKIDKIIPDGYYNTIVTKDAHNKLLNYIFKGLVNEQITIETVQEFIDDMEFWGIKPQTIFSPSFTKATTTSNPKVMAEKRRLIKAAKEKYGDNIPLSEMVKIEDTLVKMNYEENAGDSGMSLYDSGSRGSFNNDFKNNNIMLGPILNPSTKQYDLMESNYIDGISKEDLAISANIVVNAGYPKAVGTQVGGYKTKQFYAVFQSIVIDKPGSDCGTKQTRKVKLTEKNLNDHILSYIIVDGKKVLLNYENASQFIGKTVNKRSPMFCKGERICSVCAGKIFEFFDIKNAGATTVRIPNDIMEKNMKKFHDAKIVLDDVDPDKLLI